MKNKLVLPSLVLYIKSIMLGVLLVSALCELLFFPSLDNVIGIVVTLASLLLYNKYVFRLHVMRRRPISFVAFSSLILFMYLPLPITLLDGNEMSHHLFNPITTYLFQLLYFICCVFAFRLAGIYKYSFSGISVFFKRIGYFTTPSVMQLWVLGLIGWGFKYAILISQYTSESGYQAGQGTLSVFSSLIYAPLLILFYPLLGGKHVGKTQKTMVYIYMVAMMFLLISTNSRNQVVMPLLTVLLCYIISIFYKRTIVLSRTKIVVSLSLFLVVAGPLSDLAFAMLLARSQRQNTKFSVLLDKTIDIYTDKEKLFKLKSLAERKVATSDLVKSNDWNEYYVSSIFLNRVCNYRVVDASIYQAQKVGEPNQSMFDDFLIHLMIMYPQPIVDFLFGHIDKAKYAFSPQDKLYAISRNGPLLIGYRVGGDVGLSLAIFGLLAFPILIFVYFCEFLLFDMLVLCRQGRIVFSFISLVGIYSTYFLAFQIGGGIISHISFLLWGFPFSLLMFLFIYYLVRIITPCTN